MEDKFSNFLINASNQANLTGVHDFSALQINSIFIFIDPYKLDSFKMKEIPDLEINMDGKGCVWINDQQFELIEINPGISVFGIMKDDKEQN